MIDLTYDESLTRFAQSSMISEYKTIVFIGLVLLARLTTCSPHFHPIVSLVAERNQWDAIFRSLERQNEIRVKNKKSPMGQCATEQYVNLGSLVLSTAAPFTVVLQILDRIQL